MLAALGYGHYLFIASFIILLNIVCTWHGLNEEELPICRGHVHCLIWIFHLISDTSTLPRPIVHSCPHLPHGLFVNRTSQSFTKAPSTPLPSDHRCPICHAASFCFVCTYFRLSFLHQILFSLSPRLSFLHHIIFSLSLSFPLESAQDFY